MNKPSGRVVLASLLFVAASAAHGATWISTNSANTWSGAANWAGGIVANAAGDVADFSSVDISTNNISVTVDGVFTCGVLVVQDTATATPGNLTLQPGPGASAVVLGSLTGTPVISVAAMTSGKGLYTGGGFVFGGTQGLVKIGAGDLNYRYNNADMQFSGAVRIAAGNYVIERNGSLGDPAAGSAVEMAGGKLTMNPSAANQTFALDDGVGHIRPIVLLSNSILAVGAGHTLIVNGNVSGANGFTKNDPGVLVLAGTNTYGGSTTINAGVLRLSGSDHRLPTNTQFTFSNASSLDLGVTSQTVSRLTVNTGGFQANISNGHFSVLGDFDLNYVATNGAVLNAAGAQSFSFDRTNRNVNFNTGGYTGTVHAIEFRLAREGVGRNRIAASNVNVSSTAASELHGNEARLKLGTVNELFAEALMVGGYRSSGRIDFQSGLTNPALTIRGAAGGSSRMRSLTLGNARSGQINSTGVLDVATGRLDARVDTLTLGLHDINATAGSSHGYLLMGNEVSMDILNLNLSLKKDLGGNPIVTGLIAQNGGTVTVQTATFGACYTAATPTVRSTYHLSNGLLRAATLAAGTGTVNAASYRRLEWSAGTIANYDAATDLAISGQPGASGILTINLNTTNAHTFAADASRTILVGTNVLLAGAGSLSKSGAGRLTIAGSNSYSGATRVQAGTLALAGEGAIPSSALIELATQTVFDVTALTGGVTLAAGQTLSGIGTVSGRVVAASGSVVAPGGSPGVLTLAGNLEFQSGSAFAVELAGTDPGVQHDVLVVTGAVTLAGSLSGGVTNDFVPDVGSAFTVLVARSVSGTFATNTLAPPPGGGYWVLTYTATSVVLSIEPYATVTGYVLRDMNGNGSIDAEDTTNTLEGVTMRLVSGTSTSTVLTDVDGVYTFNNVVAGTYTLIEVDPSGYVSTGDEVPPNDSQIPLVIVAGDYTSGHWFLDQLQSTPYDLWAASFGIGAGQELGDSDADGYKNLLEYAAGSNPTNGSSAAPLSGVVAAGALKLTFTRNTNALDVSYYAEAGTEATDAAAWVVIATNKLGNWSGPASVVETGTGTPLTVTVTDPATTATNRYLRLRVTKP